MQSAFDFSRALWGVATITAKRTARSERSMTSPLRERLDLIRLRFGVGRSSPHSITAWDPAHIRLVGG